MPPDVDPLFLDFQAAVAGRYSLDRELGRGGMGIVYLAREVRLDRPVAIKLLPPDRAGDPALRERFLREARTAAKLSHPNIVPIHAVDETGDWVFFAMAFVDGETLGERVRRRGPLAPSEAARVLRETAWGLAHAHAHGLVHRDVKPDNILLEGASGRALVTDFGIAGGTTVESADAHGVVVGTPEFMSPEQALGHDVDARSDVYSLGVTAFFALSGGLPFRGANATELLAKHITEPAPPLASIAPTVPRRFAQAVDRCLAKRREDRPTSAELFAEQLGAALEQRRELPVALRAFVKHDARIDGLGALLYPGGAMVATGVVAGVFNLETAATLLTYGAFMALGPTALLLQRARRLTRVGFGHGDLGVAFRAELERNREERAYAAGSHAPGRLERVTRWLSYAGWGTVGAGIATAAASGAFWWMGWAEELIVGGFLAGSVFGIATLSQLQRRRDVDTEFWGKLWTGRVGKALFRVARALTPKREIGAAMTHRPTELGISMAAEQLFETLPAEMRKQLPDVPGALQRLADDATRIRERLAGLQEALAGLSPAPALPAPGARDIAAVAGERDRVAADLRLEADELQQRLQRIVAAMETIRLQLLRLHAGTSTVERFTTDLGSALIVGKEVDRWLAAREEIDRVIEFPPKQIETPS